MNSDDSGATARTGLVAVGVTVAAFAAAGGLLWLLSPAPSRAVAAPARSAPAAIPPAAATATSRGSALAPGTVVTLSKPLVISHRAQGIVRYRELVAAGDKDGAAFHINSFEAHVLPAGEVVRVIKEERATIDGVRVVEVRVDGFRPGAYFVADPRDIQ